MKNKKNIYILLPIVLFVWGAVVYQFFSLTKSDEMPSISNLGFTIKPLKFSKRVPHDINVNYRDPFLGKVYVAQTISKKIIKAPKTNKESKPKETLVWPVILYKGLISDAKGKNKLFMLVINTKNYYMKIGDTENDIFLKSGDKESIYVKYKGNLNLIMLQD